LALDDLKNGSASASAGGGHGGSSGPNTSGDNAGNQSRGCGGGAGGDNKPNEGHGLFRALTDGDIEELSGLNPVCCDCATTAPEWVSINLGVMLCITCSGVHRSLGTHVSKVRTILLVVMGRWSHRIS